MPITTADTAEMQIHNAAIMSAAIPVTAMTLSAVVATTEVALRTTVPIARSSLIGWIAPNRYDR